MATSTLSTHPLDDTMTKKMGRPPTGQVPPAEQRKRETAKLAKAGGWQLLVRLSPPAAKAMVEAKKATGAKSLNAVINAAVLAFGRRVVVAARSKAARPRI